MTEKRIISATGDVSRWIASEHDSSGKLQHYRGYSQDVKQTADLVKQRAQQMPGRFSKSLEHQYVGSVPMTMIQDFVAKRGKTMNDWATDKHLKKAFLLHMTAENPRLFAKSYQT
jgi:hypothetical protein